MINKFKSIFAQAMLISFGILTAMTLEGIAYHFRGRDITFTWLSLVSIITVAFLSSIPGLLLLNVDKGSKAGIRLQIAIHCILVYGINMGLGYLFHWYDDAYGFIFITVAYILVYAFVWFGISWMGKHEADQINSALDSIRDEE